MGLTACCQLVCVLHSWLQTYTYSIRPLRDSGTTMEAQGSSSIVEIASQHGSWRKLQSIQEHAAQDDDKGTAGQANGNIISYEVSGP